ncbi:MAG: DUF1015 domain-containing protein [Vampirovibrionia bacterium]
MVNIAPFNGVTYNFDKLDIDNDLFAPPYDVITPQYQDELTSRSPYNVVKLIYGKMYDSDNSDNNRYTRALNDYKNWLKEGVLVKSDVPKIYFYIQEYVDPKGVKIKRKGFISRCQIEDFESGKILPHEETMGGPKEDRFLLMSAVKANLSQIYGVYSDPDKKIDAILENACPSKPCVDVVDDFDVRHVLYEVSDSDALNQVVSLMKEKVVLIADGHHRYETSLRYRNEKRAEENTDGSDDKSYNYNMFYFSNLDDDGLRVYPTHRALKKSVNVSLDQLLEIVKPYFEITKYDFNDFHNCYSVMDDQDPKQIPIGLVGKDQPGSLYVLKPLYDKVVAKLKEHNVPEILVKLDVTILHRLIFEALLGLDTVELKNQNNIEFIRNEDELAEKYAANDAELIFLVGAPDVPVIREICMSGYRMPQKTTYFYPKLLSGLVINSLEEIC